MLPTEEMEEWLYYSVRANEVAHYRHSQFFRNPNINECSLFLCSIYGAQIDRPLHDSFACSSGSVSSGVPWVSLDIFEGSASAFLWAQYARFLRHKPAPCMYIL